MKRLFIVVFALVMFTLGKVCCKVKPGWGGENEAQQESSIQYIQR